VNLNNKKFKEQTSRHVVRNSSWGKWPIVNRGLGAKPQVNWGLGSESPIVAVWVLEAKPSATECRGLGADLQCLGIFPYK